MALIEITDIRKRFGKKQVLNGVRFSAERGQIIGVLGGNGCGKSTLLSILAGVLPADSGAFTVDGSDLLRDHKTRARVVGYVPQGTPLIGELNALDNLRLWYDNDRLKKELDGGMLAALGIPDFLHTQVNRMSGGMKKRLSVGCAIANDPSILLLDEPSAALDLVCKGMLLDYFTSFCRRGGTILLATHDTEEISMCSSCFVLKDGLPTPYTYHGDLHDLIGRL